MVGTVLGYFVNGIKNLLGPFKSANLKEPFLEMSKSQEFHVSFV